MSKFMKSLCKIAIPVTLQSMLQASFSIVDQIMIGQLGETNISAVGLCGNFSLIFSVVIGAVSTVAGILIAQFIGAEETKEAWCSFDVSLICGIMISALFLLAAYTLTGPIQGLIVGALSGLSAAAGVMVGKRLGSKEYDEAYTESKKIMYAGLFGAVTVSALLILLAGVYTGLYRVDDSVKELGKILLIVFALYAPVKVENMILGGGIIRSGGNTKIIMIIDIVGTWCIGIPLCLLAAYVFKWGIVGVYTLLTTEELFRLAVSLIIFRRRKWIISLC